MEWLFLQSSRLHGPQDASEFVRQHAATLIGMEVFTNIVPRGRHFIAATNIRLLPSFMDNCPNLRTLILPLHSTRLTLPSESEPRTEYAHLTTLVLKMNDGPSDIEAECFAKYFSHDQFYGLKRIKLVHTSEEYTRSSHDLSLSDEDGFYDWCLIDGAVPRSSESDSDEATNNLGEEDEQEDKTWITSAEARGCTEDDKDENTTWRSFYKKNGIGAVGIQKEDDINEDNTTRTEVELWRSHFPQAVVEVMYVPFS